TAEVQALRYEVELLRSGVEHLRERQRGPSVDPDSRLAGLEAGAPAAPAAGSAGATAPATPSSPPATPAREPAPTSTAAASDPAAAEAAYQAALDTLVERLEPAESARLFRQFITDFPDSTLLPRSEEH